MLSTPLQHTDNEWHIALEKWSDKLRIILLKQEEEIACRKETKKNLEKFIQTEGEVLFKGRIQLISENKRIQITLKKIFIGSISKSNFITLLTSVK